MPGQLEPFGKGEDQNSYCVKVGDCRMQCEDYTDLHTIVCKLQMDDPGPTNIQRMQLLLKLQTAFTPFSSRQKEQV